MPIYEYACRACGSRQEVVQAMSDPPITACASCKQEELYRLISAPGLSFKGEGWYITDYARKGKEPDSKKGSGTNVPPEKAAEKKEVPSSAGSESKGASENKSAPQSDKTSDKK